jgi:hypothetical protein
MIFEKAEKLVLKISGHDMRRVDFEMLQGSFQVTNKGSILFIWEVGLTTTWISIFCNSVSHGLAEHVRYH